MDAAGCIMSPHYSADSFSTYNNHEDRHLGGMIAADSTKDLSARSAGRL